MLFRLKTPASLAMLVAIAAASAVGAGSRYRGDKAAPPVLSPPERSCSEFKVDSQISLRKVDGDEERDGETVEFTITVAIANPCPEPLRVQYGSSVTVQTNFPSLSSLVGQPPGCLGREIPFSGVVPPHQNYPFTFRSERCKVLASAPEPPRVRIESGRVITDRGQRPVPSLARALP